VKTLVVPADMTNEEEVNVAVKKVTLSIFDGAYDRLKIL